MVWSVLAPDLAQAQGPAAPAGTSAATPDAPPQFEQTIEVVGATPIHGLGIDRDLIPSNIQAAGSDTLTRTGGVFVGEQLNLSIPSVHINEATTNPFQPDLQFRGFVGSPLLGLPQGLAVYQNGVRLNELFGDTVNWDMVPTSAVANINLMPGSNPLFGLNALGGAVSVQTKTGFSHPGHTVSVSGGSFGRYMVDASSGGHSDSVSYFVAGSALSEDGWRDFSPTRVRQLFGDVEWHDAKTRLNATLTTAANRLIGNGAAPIELLDENRSAIFTHPDETKTRMTMLSLTGQRTLAPDLRVDGVFAYRRARISTFNGDDSDYDECEDDDRFVCTDEGEGERVRDTLGDFIRIDDGDEYNGTNNTSGTLTNGWSGSAQLTATRAVASRPNHFVAGVSFDGGGSRYEADTELARLTDERGTIGIGAFDAEAAVRLRTSVRHTGLFAADFFTVAPRLTVMGAARFNHSSIELRDQLGTDLDGDHAFTRVNPAVGATYALPADTTAYGSFSTSSRVPAPSELSCADPEDPCRLPNAFVADPPLAQVVARTWEGGVRGRLGAVSWNASTFRTSNADDIMFISSGPLRNTGHFENVGDTRRQGIELSATGVTRALRWTTAYSFLNATFRTPLVLSSPNHPEEEDGEIEVEAGDRIPAIPRHNLKLSLAGTIDRLTLGGTVTATSSQFLRGDEANLLEPVAGFGLVNLTGSYALTRNVAINGRITNLFDRRYATFGLLGEADEVLGDDYEDPRFLGPGAPRAAWVGLTVAFR